MFQSLIHRFLRISEDVLKFLQVRNVDKIKIVYQGKRGNVEFGSTVKDFLASPNVHLFGKDRQKFVPKHFMTEKEV